MVSDVAIKNVEWSGRCFPHVHGRRHHPAAARTAGHRITTLGFRRRRVSATQLEPEQTCREICEVNIRQLAVRPFWHRIKISSQSQYHGAASQPRNDLRSLPEYTVLAQIARQR